MIIREAQIHDIPQIQKVRRLVRENQLSDPALVTDKDCEEYLTKRGKGWVCETNQQVVGFAIVDVLGNNVWALFLLPEYEQKGIGKTLHHLMLDWYFRQTKEPIWLSTGMHTRAEMFYRKQGWIPVGPHGKEEIKFIMTYDQWMNRNN